MDDLIRELRENADYADGEFNPEDARLMRAAADRLERLRAVICLADDLLMVALGAFPLPGNPLRSDCLIIREISGPDYDMRKRLAREVRESASESVEDLGGVWS